MMGLTVLIASASITFVNGETKCTLAQPDRTVILRKSDSNRTLRDHDRIACVKRVPAPIGVRFAVNNAGHVVRADGRTVVVHDSSSIPGLERRGKEAYSASLRIAASPMLGSGGYRPKILGHYFSAERLTKHDRSYDRYPMSHSCFLERHGTTVRLRNSGEIPLQRNDVIVCPKSIRNEAIAGGVFFDGSFFPIRADGTYFVVNPAGGPILKDMRPAVLQAYLENNPAAVNHLGPPPSRTNPPGARVDAILRRLWSASLVP